LLEQLGANKTLASVYGLGKACRIPADITVGVFDNGVIKGYEKLALRGRGCNDGL
jgi:hypothetical protein